MSKMKISGGKNLPFDIQGTITLVQKPGYTLNVTSLSNSPSVLSTKDLQWI